MQTPVFICCCGIHFCIGQTMEAASSSELIGAIGTGGEINANIVDVLNSKQSRRGSWTPSDAMKSNSSSSSSNPFRNQSPLSRALSSRSRSNSPIHYSYYATKDSDSPTLNRSYRRYVVDFPPPSPGAEWVVDNRRSRVMDQWDDESISKNCFPASIFGIPCKHKKDPLEKLKQDESSSLPSAAELSDKSLSTISTKDDPCCKHCCTVSKEEEQSSAEPQENETQKPLVEISPGVSAPLRGTNETIRAVRVDFYTPITCFGCSLEMFCIADAKYAICPQCKVISPNEETMFEEKVLQLHGLGLGFTCEALFDMQAQILLEN